MNAALFPSDLAWNLFHLALLFVLVAAGWSLQHRFGDDSDLDAASLPDTPDRPLWGTFRESNLRAVLFVAVTVLAGALRLYGVEFGFPRAYHPDELQKANFLHKMMLNDTLDPKFSLQPPLLLYLSWGVARVFDAVGFDVGNNLLRNLLAGRVVNVILGTATIPLVYCLARRVTTPWAALFAASLVAVSPLHITNSRYMKEDVLFLFFVLLCCLSALKAVQERRPIFLYLAGALAGIAFGSKYTGVVSVVIVACVPWLFRRKFSLIPNWRWLAREPLALVMMPAFFLLTLPFALGNARAVWIMFAGLQSESRHAMRGHMGLAIDAWSQLWMFHLSRSIVPGFGFFATALGLLGVGLMLRRMQTLGLFLVGCLVMFYLPAEWAKSKPPPQPDRYVLACVPFLAVLAAEALRWIAVRVRVTEVGLRSAAFASLLLAGPLWKSVVLAGELTDDTRHRMSEWMAESLAKDSRVLVMGGTTYLPSVPRPLVSVAARKVLGRGDEDLLERLAASGFDFLLLTSPSAEQFQLHTAVDSETRRSIRAIERTFPLVVEMRAKHGTYGFHNPVVKLFRIRGVTVPAALPDGTARASAPQPEGDEDDTVSTPDS